MTLTSYGIFKVCFVSSGLEIIAFYIYKLKASFS